MQYRIEKLVASLNAWPDVGVLPESEAGIFGRIVGSIEHNHVQPARLGLEQSRRVVYRVHVGPLDNVSELSDEPDARLGEQPFGPVGYPGVGMAHDVEVVP